MPRTAVDQFRKVPITGADLGDTDAAGSTQAYGSSGTPTRFSFERYKSAATKGTLQPKTGSTNTDPDAGLRLNTSGGANLAMIADNSRSAATQVTLLAGYDADLKRNELTQAAPDKTIDLPATTGKLVRIADYFVQIDDDGNQYITVAVNDPGVYFSFINL